jgi:hypothetical protein
MHTHDKPASFHGSPHEAMQAPPEEFLYLGTTERLSAASLRAETLGDVAQRRDHRPRAASA